MNRLEELQKRYAQMMLRFGVNLQMGQGLFVWAPVDAASFVAILSEEAYRMGARAVIPMYFDPLVLKARIELGDPALVNDYPVEEGKMQVEFAKQGYAFLKLNRFLSIEPNMNTMGKDQIIQSFQSSFQTLSKYTHQGLLQSCSSVVPTKSWARLVYPDMESDVGENCVWQELSAILQLNHEDRMERMAQRLEKNSLLREELNQKQYQRLDFKSTTCDFQVKLLDRHLWVGSTQYTKQMPSIGYLPNFPTEELFCGNLKYGVEGYFSITRPFLIHGRQISDLRFDIKEGRIISMQSNQDIASFREYLQQREDRQYFGEIALVSSKSPIAQRNLIFQSVLLDENAACHIAIGNGYEVNIDDYIGNKEQRGMNSSDVHLDLMFGSEDLEVSAVRQDGKVEIITLV